jgi:glucose/arabinose dehydrogenase
MISMRTMPLLLCLALAGCAGAGASSSLSNFAPEPAASASPAAQSAVADPPLLPGPMASADKPKSRSAKNKKKGKDDDADDTWWKEGGITREKINAMCWMKYEKGRADLPLEKRADLVNACVAETLKKHPLN